MDKKRILFIIASSDMGGAENFVYTLLKSLDSEKFEKYIVCPAGGYYNEKYNSFAKKALFIDRSRSFMNPTVIAKVSNFIKDNEINIIHTMLYTSDFCGIVAGKLSGRKVRTVNTINGYNFLILKTHGLRLKRRIASLVYRFIYRFSDLLIAVAEAVRKDLIERRGIKVPPGKISTILAAGTSESYDNFSEEDIASLRSGMKPTKMIAAAIGTLNDVKDYDNLLEGFSIAAGQNADIGLLIAGDGPERRRLEKRAIELGIRGKVHFLGALEERKKNALLSLSDVIILSSRSEGCPTVLFEAMYFGKPVIATRVGGVPEVVDDGKAGMLVPAGSPPALAEALIELSGDIDKRSRLGRRAREIFELKFTNRHVIAAYENIYYQLST